jgi:aquaporin related protein
MDSESKNRKTLRQSWRAETDLMLDTVAVLAEFVGTTLFLFLAFAGTQLANFGKNQQSSGTDPATAINLGVLMYISLSFGFSLMVNAWIFFRISGGLFNPAVSFKINLTYDTR